MYICASKTKMRKIWLALVACIVVSMSLSAQQTTHADSQTIVTIDTIDFSLEEFERSYRLSCPTKIGDSASIYSYLNRFIEYKMKVIEAENEQLDTTRAFKDSFFKCLKQTAHDRMYDGAEEMREQYVRTEYDRLHWDYEVAHIFIKSNRYDSPKDTLMAFQKMQKIQKELKSGKSFEACVQEYSDDKLSKEYNGNVGYITAMVSPFEYEEKLYQMEVGQIATVRTLEGWYFIKVLNKRETKGAVDAAIILIYPHTDDAEDWANAKLTIDSIYNQLQNGASFDSLSNLYNRNENLVANHGIMGLVDNGMPYSRVLKETLFNLEHDGDYSTPIQLPYGYAIVKRRWQLPLPGFEAYKTGYEKRIAADKSRCKWVDDVYVEKMKNNLNFIVLNDALEKQCLPLIDASILLGKWTKPNLESTEEKVLFKIGDEKYSLSDFLDYLQIVQKNLLPEVHDKDMLVRLRFQDYVTRRLEFASMKNMEKNDKDFQYAMQEYHDGMIVSELRKQEVIQESVRDSVGMKFYFNQHRENYMTAERTVSAWIYIKNPKLHDKVLEMLYEQQDWYYWHDNKTKYAEKMEHYKNIGSPQLYILDVINSKKAKSIDVDTKEPLISPNDVILKRCGPEDAPKECIMPNMIADFVDSLHVAYYDLASRQLTYEEAKEQLLMDYQQELEKQWIKAMYKRHTIEIHKEVVDKLRIE